VGLEQEIASVLNRHSQENASNTPDFLLARFLLDCLGAFNRAVRDRESWYGRDPNMGPAGQMTDTNARPT